MKVPLTRIQKLIGERMLRSKLTKPCFYIESKADVTDLMALRLKLRKSLRVKITSNAFFIRVLALAAKRYPLMLGRPDNGGSPLPADVAGNELGFTSIRIADAINVGFPVHAPQGLVVAVVKDAHTKTMAEIGQLEKSLTEKARSNKLTLEQMQGQTIGFSNLGAYGIDSFRGIVAPPASTILCVGNVVRTPVPANGQIVVRKIAALSLAVDRRIITSLYAAEFLDFIVEQLQNPQQLI